MNITNLFDEEPDDGFVLITELLRLVFSLKIKTINLNKSVKRVGGLKLITLDR
jgi:hypothetical protein